MKIYLSSTYVDLKRHRAVVARALRKARYDVVIMEEYAARNARVESACQGDVIACDIYAGIFAWRYGHIPTDDNPDRLSVTEMEYSAAGAKPMPRLTFLLDDKARWPKEFKDTDLARISELRARLKTRCSAYFANADGLAVEVLAAVRVEESTRRTSQLEAIDQILEAEELGPSYMMNIKDKLGMLARTSFVEILVGPTPWWSTRLHLVSALAEEFGRTRGLVFVDEAGRFLLMAAPSEVKRRLALRWPDLERAYGEFRRDIPTLDAVGEALWRYPMSVQSAFAVSERDAKHVLTARDLEYELGIARDAEVVEVDGKGQRLVMQEVLGRQTPFAALVRQKRVEGLVDREMLARHVAQSALAQV
jgi:hypothetical protein